MVFFFFKQKTAYELRISDWSSDVCSADLLEAVHRRAAHQVLELRVGEQALAALLRRVGIRRLEARPARPQRAVREQFDAAHLELVVVKPGRRTAACGTVRGLDAVRIADRTSTRLNSSH